MTVNSLAGDSTSCDMACESGPEEAGLQVVVGWLRRKESDGVFSVL